MSDSPRSKPASRPASEVPSSRLKRLGKLGGLAARLAGNALITSAGQLAKAQRPSLSSTLLTTENALNITERLSQMRGAAMKVGQLLSMDAGEFLPKEWEPILAQLRQGADPMPKTQLLYMLNTHWGPGWQEQFQYFSFEPIASASIGQVHKAILKTGQSLAVKVQYPGVLQSIASDVNNIGRLLKLARVVPPELKLDNLLDDAKTQLMREADYQQEVSFMQQYAQCIADDPRFSIPTPYLPLCNQFILAMSFESGVALDELAGAQPSTIDFVCNALMELTLRELFETGLMQSDPNFANYFYQPDKQRIMLLDFGACCHLSMPIRDAYLDMASAMQKQHRDAMYDAFLRLGLLRTSMSEEVKRIVLDATMTASECLQTETYSFAEQRLVSRLYEQTQGLMRNRDAVASPSFDSALVNRKISGMILLANRLGATLAMRSALAKYL